MELQHWNPNHFFEGLDTGRVYIIKLLILLDTIQVQVFKDKSNFATNRVYVFKPIHTHINLELTQVLVSPAWEYIIQGLMICDVYVT